MDPGFRSAAEPPDSEDLPEGEPQFDPFEPEPYVEPPRADGFDDPYRMQGDVRPDEVPPFQTQAGGAGGGYRPPRRPPTANYSLWLGAGLGVTVTLLVLFAVVALLVGVWGRKVLTQPFAEFSGATSPSRPEPLNRSPPATSPPATSPPATSPPATSPPAGPFFSLPPAPTASGGNVRRVVDLLESVPPPDGSSQSDFVTVKGKPVSRPEGLSVLQFPTVRPTANYELVARVTRLSGVGKLVLGASHFGSPIGVTLDDYHEVGYLSGIEMIRRRRLDQTGNETRIRGQQLPPLQTVTVVIAFQMPMREVRISVDGREMIRCQVRPGSVEYESELADYLSSQFFVAAQNAEFRIEDLEMRLIDTTRRR